MELAKIEKLLENYLEAKTTLEEEKILKDYFSQKDVPPHLNEYKVLFNYFSNSSLDTSVKTISLPKNRSIINWLAIAAMAVFFVSIFSIYQNNINEREQAELAYMETQRALELISFNLNKGTNAIAKLQTFENTQNKIFKIN
jgi:hypothetical protein